MESPAVSQTSPVQVTKSTAQGTSTDLPLDGECQPGDDGFIERLIHQFHADVYRYGFRLSGNAADAEDLSQQVFLAAHQHIGQLRNLQRARSWLLSITRNQFLKTRRRQRPVDSTSVQLEVNQVPESIQREDIDEEQIQLALAEMLEDYRTVLLMYYFEDMSYREIADQLQIAMGTVMSRLSRAKGQLRYKLLSRQRADDQFQQDSAAP